MKNEMNVEKTASELQLHAAVQVRIAGEDIFLGPGAARLLRYVDAAGSIQEACKEMGLSYSKGSHIIKKAEKNLGFKLLERWTGGKEGGGSRLTEEGKRFLDCYEKLYECVQKSADELFRVCFTDEVLSGKES